MSSDDVIFSGLNEQQRSAVETTEGPLLILAGAGSGKTRALTHRIAYLISKGVPAWQILAVTFTNKAAKEMSTRIVNLLHLTEQTQRSVVSGQWSTEGSQLPVMGTFHSVCVRILRRDIERIGRDRNFVIYDSSDQETLMKQILRDRGIDVKELKPRAALGAISRAKSEAQSVREMKVHATTEFEQRVSDLYAEYQKRLMEHNALDFDDLLLETVRLFREVPSTLERYQKTWRYLHIDEYQDTNHVQYILISLLAKEHRNLCVIGDPDQSIYAFRGADIRNILDFQKEHADARVIKLERNYRSTKQIIDASDAVIAVNPRRPEKKMWTERTDGSILILQETADEKREAEEAIRSVLDCVTQGMKLNDQAILYRTNAQSRLFEEACLRNGLPYRLIGATKFYARTEVKDVLAYLYVLQNPQDTLSLLRIINVPSRKIGKTTIERLQLFCQDHNRTLWSILTEVEILDDLPQGVKDRIRSFATLIQKYQERRREVTVATLAKEMLDEVHMERWLRDDTTEGEARWENVGELLTVMHKYDTLPPEQSMTSFLEEAALVSEVDKLTDVSDDALTLMTLHLCKGLEFRHVIIAGCEEGIFPHSNALFDREQLEEERRLMYVGMTRAKDKLRLMTARCRSLWGAVQANEPSRFLDDIPANLAERKSDELLSSFSWPTGHATEGSPSAKFDAVFGAASAKSSSRTGRSTEKIVDLDFNQDPGSLYEPVSQVEVELEVGSRIRHRAFGEGTVTAKRGDVVDIHFDRSGKKTLALSIAPIEVL